MRISDWSSDVCSSDLKPDEWPVPSLRRCEPDQVQRVRARVSPISAALARPPWNAQDYGTESRSFPVGCTKNRASRRPPHSNRFSQPEDPAAKADSIDRKRVV